MFLTLFHFEIFIKVLLLIIVTNRFMPLILLFLRTIGIDMIF